MSRIARLLAVLALPLGCLFWCASCGSGSVASAAPAAQVPGSVRTEVTLVTKAGREDKMEIYGFSHEVLSPRDAASGLPTGKRQHKPLTITKPIDQATPLLLQGLLTDEVYEQLIFTAYRRSGGSEMPYLTIVLQQPSILSVANDDAGASGQGDHEVREHVQFTYQKITWTWADGGITAEDDWETPVR